MASKPRGIDRFGRSRTVLDLNPEAGEYTIRRYFDSRIALDQFDRYYRELLNDKIHCPLYPRQRLLNYGRHVYGLRLQRS